MTGTRTDDGIRNNYSSIFVEREAERGKGKEKVVRSQGIVVGKKGSTVVSALEAVKG